MEGGWTFEERGKGGVREERVQEDRMDGGEEGVREEGQAGRWGIEGRGREVEECMEGRME